MALELRSTIRTRLVPMLLLATLAIAGWLVVGGLLFRSGLYYRYVASPDSTAGEAERALIFIEKRYRPGARNVLVLGDSRTSEGFSSKLANQTVPGVNFIEAGMAGTTPRVWYYLLRKVDPDGNRFAAVVLVQIADRGQRLQDWLVARASDASVVATAVACLVALEVFAPIDGNIPFLYFRF